MTALSRTIQEPQPSRELAPANGDGLPSADDFARAQDALQALKERGDTESLHGASIEAHAQALYHQRNHHKEAADGFSRLKVLAEAALGRIDIDQSRIIRTGRSQETPFVVGGQPLTRYFRSCWRQLAVGELRGLLDKALDELASDPAEQISTHAVARLLWDKGAGWVDPAPLVAALKHSELSAREIERRAGVSHDQLARLARQDGRVLKFETAAALAEVLGVDQAKLPLARRHLNTLAMKRAQTRKRAANAALREKERAKAAKRHGGNIAEAFSLLRKCAQVLDPAEHDFSTREAKEHVRHAYAYLTKAEYEIAQALGVE